MGKKERIFTSLASMVSIVLISLDILEDAQEGAALEHMIVEILILGMLASVLIFVTISWLKTKQSLSELSISLANVKKEYSSYKADTKCLSEGISERIDAQLESWGLSKSEKEIVLLMLKGLSHKDIAALRSTSEATVRQQAATVYKKSSLTNRNELIAFFLEDMLVLK